MNSDKVHCQIIGEGGDSGSQKQGKLREKLNRATEIRFTLISRYIWKDIIYNENCPNMMDGNFQRLKEGLRNIGFWYGVISLVIRMLISGDKGMGSTEAQEKKQWIIRDPVPKPLFCPYIGIKCGRKNWWDVKIPIRNFIFWFCW